MIDFLFPESHIDIHDRKAGHIRSFQGRVARANSKRAPIRLAVTQHCWVTATAARILQSCDVPFSPA
jgi:hypothetical protein